MPNNSDSGWKLHLVHHNSCQVYTTNIIWKERPHFKQTPRRYKCPKLFSKGKTPLFDVNINIGCFLFVIAPIILKRVEGGGVFLQLLPSLPIHTKYTLLQKNWGQRLHLLIELKSNIHNGGKDFLMIHCI